MSERKHGRGLLRLGIVLVVLWAGYWGYEAVAAGKLWFSLSDTFGVDSGVAKSAYAEREFAKRMLFSGPIAGIVIVLAGRWIYNGFSSGD